MTSREHEYLRTLLIVAAIGGAYLLLWLLGKG